MIKSLLAYALFALLLFIKISGFQSVVDNTEDTRRQERLRLHAVGMPDPRVVIIGLDDAVYESGRFNRREHATLINKLTAAGASQIFFDVEFDEPRGPELDGPLARAIELSGRVVVAGAYGRTAEGLIWPTFYPELSELVQKRRARLAVINTSRQEQQTSYTMAYDDQSEQNPWPRGLQPAPALSLFAGSAHLQASDLQVISHPGRDWWTMLAPPASFDVTRKLEGATQGEGDELPVYKLPLIFYPPATGPQGHPELPGRLRVEHYLDVVDAEPSTLGRLRGAIALVGENRKGAVDLYHTEVGPMKGVEIHAQMLSNLLTGRVPKFRETSPPVAWFSRAGRVLLSLLLLTIGSRRGTVRALTGWFLLAEVAWEAAVYAGDSRLWLLEQTEGELWLLLAYCSAMLVRFVTTNEHLALFVPQALRGQLHAQVKIFEGATRATVMVTDIRGYTTLSESRTPLEILHLLKEYHDETVALYTRHTGIVLNYQGDAQIILFGHLSKGDDPAGDAVRAGLAASEAVARLRKRWNLPPEQQFMVGLGICTGEVIIAELGGEFREYTVIGENVRKCHKLQSLSPLLHANIIMDESTYASCKQKPDGITRRDGVQVEGWAEPVTLFTADPTD